MPDKLKSIILRLIAAFSLVMMLISCGGNKKNIPDISNIKLDLSFKRFEKDFFSLDTSALEQAVRSLENNYPRFLSCWMSDVFNIPPDSTGGYYSAVLPLRRYGGLNASYDSTMKLYGDVDWLKADMEKAFKYYLHHLPGFRVPEVVTFVSEYSVAAFTCGDSVLGIGLDMYLGS